MELVGKAQLRRDVSKHGDAVKVIEAWIKVVESQSWASIAEVKQTYRSADYVNGKTIFNIKGNSYRLAVAIDYELELVVYDVFLTHAQYDKYKF